MSRFTDQSMIAVQVETDRVNTWVPDGITHGTYPISGTPLVNLLALPAESELRPINYPFAGMGLFAIARTEDSAYSVDTTTKKIDGVDYVTKVALDKSASRTMGPVLLQTKFPTPVTPGDKVNFSGRLAVRRTGGFWQGQTRQKRPTDELGAETDVDVRVSVWGIGPTNDEYGDTEDIEVRLLDYSARLQTGYPVDGMTDQVIFTIPTVSPATVPQGITRVHLTVALKAVTTGGPISASFTLPAPDAWYIGNPPDRNMVTLSNAQPLRLTVTATPPAPAQPPADSWETRTQEQNRLWRYTYADVTGDVAKIGTERIEADLGVTTVRFVSSTAPAVVTAGKRLRVLALHPDGTFTTIVAGTVRTRRLVHDGVHAPQLEVGVHDCHHRLVSTECGVAFDALTEYRPILNSLGVVARIDGVECSGAARQLPDWGGVYPSYTEDALSVFDSLVMSRNSRKAFLRITRRDHVEVLSALPAGVALDISDVPQQGHMPYSVNIEYGSDTTDLVNEIAVQENMIDPDSLDRELGTDPPPVDLDYLESKSRTATYRRTASIDAYGLSRHSFAVVRGSGTWADIEAGNYGGNFAAWAAAILDEYSGERTGPKSVTLPITTAAERALVASLEVLDAVVVRFQGQAQVRRIRRISHDIQPGRWTVELRFDVSGDQVYWTPATPVPAAFTRPIVPRPPYNPGTDLSLYAATAGAEGGDVSPALSGSLDGGTP